MKKVVAKGKTVEEAIQNAIEELKTTRDKVETKVLELPTNGLMGLFGSKNAKVEVTLNVNHCTIAKDFISDILRTMDMEAKITTKLMDGVLTVLLEGKDMGILIGRRGQTLDSLQYLTSLVVNRQAEEYIRVIMDTENYRSKRESTLKDLAEKLAYKVQKIRRKIELEPMNPYERRIIHSTLQKNNRVVTYSEGEEPFRRVVIDIKKTS
ncbi:MAG: RNA-binding cell elongation regulator Jag/EloR [Eubacteriales bacterium]